MSSGRDLRVAQGPPIRKGNHRRSARQLASTSKRRPSRGGASRHAGRFAWNESGGCRRGRQDHWRDRTFAPGAPVPVIASGRPRRIGVFRRGSVLLVRTTCASQPGASTPRLMDGARCPASQAGEARVLPRGARHLVTCTSWPAASGGLAAARAMPAMAVRRPHVARSLARRLRSGRGRPSTGQPLLGRDRFERDARPSDVW